MMMIMRMIDGYNNNADDDDEGDDDDVDDNRMIGWHRGPANFMLIIPTLGENQNFATEYWGLEGVAAAGYSGW